MIAGIADANAIGDVSVGEGSVVDAEVGERSIIEVSIFGG